MLEVLKSRMSVMKTVQSKLEHEGYDGLLMWLITSSEDTLTVDVLPHLCKEYAHVYMYFTIYYEC